MLGSGPVLAQDARNHLYDTFQFNASGAVVLFGGTVKVSGDQTNGSEINLHDVLGLSNTKFQPRGVLRWRPGHRHELEIGYQFARRSGEKTLDRDITFNDSTYQAGVKLKTIFNTDQAFFTWRYAIRARERQQLGFGLGLGAFFLDPSLEVTAGVAGGAQTGAKVSKSFVGPTASVGLFGKFRAGDRWYFDADLRGITIKVDRVRASVVEGGAAARYFVSRPLGFELGYNISSVKVTIDPRSGSTGGSNKISFPFQTFRLGVVYAP
jgi:hypothetical protein